MTTIDRGAAVRVHAGVQMVAVVVGGRVGEGALLKALIHQSRHSIYDFNTYGSDCSSPFFLFY